ncbi:uncharacterized protein LOC134824856 [Bolinopsis microptera]|uniref:uncharacterized protein LOC134824856 n=1 Tax=Bolinopsis microptera TaxID=2820187 RepID=UPI0030793451
MKVFVILIGVFSAVSAVDISCNGGTGYKDVQCADGVLACTSPVWSEYGGLTDQLYKCGECPADSSATCAQCVPEENDGGCNKDPTPSGAKTFECFDYSLVSDKLVKSETATICHAEEATAIACNKPEHSAVLR